MENHRKMHFTMKMSISWECGIIILIQFFFASSATFLAAAITFYLIFHVFQMIFLRILWEMCIIQLVIINSNDELTILLHIQINNINLTSHYCIGSNV